MHERAVGHARGVTFVDAVVRHSDVDARLDCADADVLQLLHGLFAHVLQLAHMVIHIGNLHLASCPGAAGGHLQRSSKSPNTLQSSFLVRFQHPKRKDSKGHTCLL
jgi:hypothetical protein